MHTLLLPYIGLPRPRYTTELRIDVRQDAGDIERELDAVHGRMRRPGDALHALPVICMQLPGLVLRYRQADGEHYVYAEDLAQGRLAAYIVFNRLIELDRRADRHLRAPHAKVAPAYQRRGIATAIYRWWLEGGNCLITGARQSAGAHAMWRALGRTYESFYVGVSGKQLRDLTGQLDRRTLDDLHTRVVLLGRGWSKDRLAACTGMRMQAAPGAAVPQPRRRSLWR